MLQFLKRHVFFSTALLPPTVLMSTLLLILSTSGQVASLDNSAYSIAKSTNAVTLFQYARNLLFIAYIANFLIQIFRNHRQNIKGLILTTAIGLFLTLFSLVIAGVLYDLVSVVITFITNPSSIPGLKIPS